MTPIERIPQISGADPRSLYANALRLYASDGPHQAGAAALIAPIELELEARRAAEPPKPVVVRKSRAKKAGAAA